MTVKDHFVQGLHTIIDTLGGDVGYTPTGGALKVVRLAISAIPKENAELIASVGIDGSMAYLLPIVPAPEKYDQIHTKSGSVWAVHVVSEIIVAGDLVGYRLGLKK